MVTPDRMSQNHGAQSVRLEQGNVNTAQVSRESLDLRQFLIILANPQTFSDFKLQIDARMANAIVFSKRLSFCPEHVSSNGTSLTYDYSVFAWASFRL